MGWVEVDNPQYRFGRPVTHASFVQLLGLHFVLSVWEVVGDGRSGTLMGRSERPVCETPHTFTEADEVGGRLSSAGSASTIRRDGSAAQLPPLVGGKLRGNDGGAGAGDAMVPSQPNNGARIFACYAHSVDSEAHLSGSVESAGLASAPAAWSRWTFHRLMVGEGTRDPVG